MNSLNRKILENFPEKVVRKDLTSIIKHGANAPTFLNFVEK